MIRTYGAASSGLTSGLGLAIANTIASLFMRASASAGSARAPETPISRSAPSITSAGAPERLLGVGDLGEPALDAVHRAVEVVLALDVQRAARVGADDVAHARGEQDLRDRDPGRAEPDHQHVQVLQAAAGELDRVQAAPPSRPPPCRAGRRGRPGCRAPPCSRSSISKQRGAEMSSRLIPPKPGAISLTVRTISSGPSCPGRSGTRRRRRTP